MNWKAVLVVILFIFLGVPTVVFFTREAIEGSFLATLLILFPIVSLALTFLLIVFLVGRVTKKISAEDYVRFEMLAGHSYTIEATFNDLTESSEAIVRGFQGLEFGGFISVRVWQSSDTIESVSYQEPLLE